MDRAATSPHISFVNSGACSDKDSSWDEDRLYAFAMKQGSCQHVARVYLLEMKQLFGAGLFFGKTG